MDVVDVFVGLAQPDTQTAKNAVKEPIRRRIITARLILVPLPERSAVRA
jgi:hypothetical protein